MYDMKAMKHLPIAALAIALLFSRSAGAAETKHTANPTAWCQGALPAFETALRKRPLAIQNEGNVTAFVTCSIPIDSTGVPLDLTVDTSSVEQVVQVDVSCTLVAGFHTGANRRITKTVTTSDDGTLQPLFWSEADIGVLPFEDARINLSCALPPGAGLNRITLTTSVGVR